MITPCKLQQVTATVGYLVISNRDDRGDDGRVETIFILNSNVIMTVIGRSWEQLDIHVQQNPNYTCTGCNTTGATKTGMYNSTAELACNAVNTEDLDANVC